MESTNFKAMVVTASSKYAKLVESMHMISGITEDDLNKNLNLIHSIYMDEMDLIATLHGTVMKNEEAEKKVELKLFDFMVKR